MFGCLAASALTCDQGQIDESGIAIEHRLDRLDTRGQVGSHDNPKFPLVLRLHELWPAGHGPRLRYELPPGGGAEGAEGSRLERAEAGGGSDHLLRGRSSVLLKVLLSSAVVCCDSLRGDL